jgi:RHS repeat-associated protein
LLSDYAFTGRQWDGDAGLYYNRARWYDANTGRF